MNSFFSAIALSIAVILCSESGFAAQVIDLNQQPVSILQSFMSDAHRVRGVTSGLALEETSKSVDFNQTTHTRIRETYLNYPVWGSEAIVHYPQGVVPSLAAVKDNRTAAKVSMDGVFYRDISRDLDNTPVYIFTQAQADKALAAAVQKYKEESQANFTISAEKSTLFVYVDDRQRAHWAFQVSFKTSRIRSMPVKLVYVLDAVTFAVYEHWNNLKTSGVLVSGGGIGGNGNMGKVIYDGAEGNRPVLDIERGGGTKVCYLRNETVIIRDRRYRDEVPSFRCEKPDPQHHNVYWNTVDDAANGGYSPNNDGLYSDKIVREMYTKWFGVPMLVKDGKPMQVTFYVHDPMQEQNAYYDDGEMVFGEGDNESYPVVAPSVVAHEMSHGFTEQYAGLHYRGQSGGIDESFSDMADKAVEYYVSGKNNWGIDAELLKDGGHMLRYMDEPTKDCEGKKEGESCSISHFKNYKKSTDVHHSSGIFNKAFYLMASKWNTHQAFAVMVQANMHYWTANANFARAACGIVKAARDYKYDEQVVRDAMREVGVSTAKC